jgi:membrane-associated phospholipid phosphatase
MNKTLNKRMKHFITKSQMFFGMVRLSGFILAMLFSAEMVCSQTTDSVRAAKIYKVNYWVSGGIIAAGAATDAFAIDRIKNKAAITDEEIATLNPNLLNSIDRWALQQDPTQYQRFATISDYAQIPIFVLLPAALAFDKKIRKDWLDILFMYLEGHIVTFTFYNYSWLGPTFQDRYRPLTYYDKLDMSDRESGNNRNSFYSGHTASVAFTSFFVAKVFCDYHPEFNFGTKFLVYTAALVPPVLEGYFRVRALAHFPSDDMVGLSLGAALGIIIPELHKIHYKGLSVGVQSSANTLGLSLNWKIPGCKKCGLEE